MREVEILTAAKSKIENRWIKMSLHDERGGVCAVGSLDHLLGVHTKDPEIKSSLSYLFQAIFGRKGCESRDFTNIENWNDMGNRCKGDVVAAFDKAIALAKEEDAAA